MTPIRLTTPRLLLRDYVETDFQGVHAYACDPATVRFMLWGPNTPEETHNFIQLAISQQAEDPRLDFDLVVVSREIDEIIGGCGIHIVRPAHKSAEIGYVFNQHFWGQGYATETMVALLQFGFEQLGMHRISATCDPQNIGSERVMQKNGLRREGLFRDHLWQKGAWRDSYLYAILDHEWRENQ